MKSLVKCHFHYLVNNVTLLIAGIIFIISIFSDILCVSKINHDYSFMENNLNYFNNTFFTMKLIGTFLSVFLFGHSFLSKSDQYIFLILPRNVSRYKYFITKVLTILFMLFLFVWFEYVIYLLVGMIGYSNFIFSKTYGMGFINLYILMIFYGLLGLILVLIGKNIYMIIVPIFLMIIGSMMNENGLFVFNKIYNALFLNLLTSKPEFIYGNIHALLCLVCIFLINLVIYNNMDFS